MRIKLVHLERISSTQDYAKNQLLSFMPGEGVLYVADEQTKGRGTHGRQWSSPPGNIYATLVFLLPVEKQDILCRLPQVVAYSIASGLHLFNLMPQLKWVNDVLLRGKKVSGVLCEASHTQSDSLVVYVGFGVNVNMPSEMLVSLSQPATSVHLELGVESFSKNAVLDEIMKSLSQNIDILVEKGFTPFYQGIDSMMAFKNEEIYFDTESNDVKGRVIKGTLLGINERGELILQNDNGDIQPFFNGRILRGKELSDYLSEIENDGVDELHGSKGCCMSP